MTADIEQTPAELQTHLGEQLSFLKASAAGFDGGFEGEAKRLAQAMRVLLHERPPSSRAVLAQLGLLDSRKFFDSARPNLPGNGMSYDGLLVTGMFKEGARYFPLLDDHQMGPGEWIPFEKWWRGVVFVDSMRREMTRRDLVLSVCDKDGGAHVDPKVTGAYADLSRRNSLGWETGTSEEMRPMPPPHLPATRQVAHEVLKSLVPNYTCHGPKVEPLMWMASAMAFDEIPRVLPGWMTGTGTIVRPSARGVARNEPCMCGSGQKFKRCCGR